METNQINLVIALTAFATIACRWVPVAAFSNREFSPVVKSFLHFCPIAILCAMIAPDVFLVQGKMDLSFSNKFFWVFLVCLAIAMKTKNIAVTVLVSATLLALWRWIELI